MKIRRNVASIPARSAHETWRAIVNLVTGPDSLDHHQLKAAASIMETLIADEQPSRVPIAFTGSGPRLVIYCLYDDDALQTGLDIDSLMTNPTAAAWQATAPCEPDDVEWMNAALKQRAPRISVHPTDDGPPAEDNAEQAIANIAVNWRALENS